MVVSELIEDTQDQICDLLENLQQIEKLKNKDDNMDLINFSFDTDTISKNNKSEGNIDDYRVNNKAFSENIKMMYEFIEFKYFKKIMNQNKNIS